MLELARWPNAVIAASGVWLGALTAGAVTGATWLAALAAVALTAVANSVNDLYDFEIDRVAHPARPLPRGAIDRAGALAVAGTAAAVALAASLAVSPSLGALSTGVLVVMVAYSHSVKRRGLPGNLLVAVVASLPFVYGAWSAGRPERGLALLALAAPLHFAREVAKDLDDEHGDSGVRRTLPIALGRAAARAAVVGALALFALLAARYFVGSAFPALAVLGASLACVASAALGTARDRRGAPRALKGAMLLAMAAAAVDVVLGRA